MKEEKEKKEGRKIFPCLFFFVFAYSIVFFCSLRL